MKTLSTYVVAVLLSLPALGNAGPPDDLERQRTALDALRGHPAAAAVSRDLDEMSLSIDEARARWQRGESASFTVLMPRIDAQAALVRARLEVVTGKAQLQETERALATTRQALETERARHADIRARLEGGR